MNEDAHDATSPLDDAINAWLIAYEEWRAGNAGEQHTAPQRVPPSLRRELQQIAHCIDLLDQTLNKSGDASRIDSKNSRGGSHASANAESLTTHRSIPSGEAESITISSPPDKTEIPRLGKFEILRELGRGGFSIVYLATDTVTKRNVALKVPLPDVLMTADLGRRWLREAQALASLDHPNIVRVLEAGQIGPICYIASEFCDGPTLGAWLDDPSHEVSPILAAQLVKDLAAAVEHAHQRGILHRDIKPSNVLLVRHTDADPTRDVFAMLTDFGLAKMLDPDEGKSDASQFGYIIGTPEFMAPEQALNRTFAMGPATDVYGLGAVLFKLLTRQSPRRDLANALLSGDEFDGAPPRGVRPEVPRDLDSITCKCLASDPSDRYPSAQALHDDLLTFLDGRPLTANRRWWSGRRLRPTRLPQRILWMGLIATALVVVGSVVTAARLIQARRLANVAAKQAHQFEGERNRAVRHLAEVEQRVQYASQMRLAQQAWEHGRKADALSALEVAHELLGKAGDVGLEWRLLSSRMHREKTTWPIELTHIDSIAVSRDGSMVAFAGSGGQVRLWNVHTNQEVSAAALTSPIASQVLAMAFSVDGKRLAAIGQFLTSGGQAHRQLVVWNIATNDPPARIDQAGLTGCLAFSPGNNLLAVGSREGLTIWDTARPYDQAIFIAAGDVRSTCFSADGNQVATGTSDGTVHVWNSSGVRLQTIKHCHPGAVRCLSYSPQGELLATGGDKGSIQVWNTKTDSRHSLLQRHVHDVVWVAFASDQTLVSADRDFSGGDRPGELICWDIANAAVRSTFSGHRREITTAGLLDARTLITGANDGRIKTWDLEAPDPTYDLLGHDSEVWSVAFARSDHVLATASDDHTVRLWDLEKRAEPGVLAGHRSMVSSVAFAGDGKTLATASYDGTAILWDVPSRKPLCTLTGHTAPLRCVAISPDGKLVATGGKDNTVRLWNAADGKLLKTMTHHTDHVRAIVFTPAGDCISAGLDFTVQVHDRARDESRLFARQPESILSMAISEDGNTLAAGCVTGVIRLWDLASGSLRNTFGEDSHPIMSLAFAPNGNTLATGSRNGVVRLWDPTSAQIMLSFSHPESCNSVMISPSGQELAAGFHDGLVRVWSVSQK